jgi:hypothetical protein
VGCVLVAGWRSGGIHLQTWLRVSGYLWRTANLRQCAGPEAVRGPPKTPPTRQVTLEPDCPPPGPRVNASLVTYITPKARPPGRLAGLGAFLCRGPFCSERCSRDRVDRVFLASRPGGRPSVDVGSDGDCWHTLHVRKNGCTWSTPPPLRFDSAPLKKPSPRPQASELILFGGEVTDLSTGKVLVNADLYRFDCEKRKWTRVHAPSRCGAGCWVRGRPLPRRPAARKGHGAVWCRAGPGGSWAPAGQLHGQSTVKTSPPRGPCDAAGNQ